jgi:hypothetical protein
MFGEGGPRGWAASKRSMGEFKTWLDANPAAKANQDSAMNLMTNGELRYNLSERGMAGQRVPRAFWTRDAVYAAKHGNKQQLMTAAAYVDRRLMSGAYQAWKEGGAPAVRDFFTSDKRGIAIAKESNLPPELLSEFVGRNLDTIANVDPTFLPEAERVRNEAMAGTVRKELAKWMKNTDRNVPVSGHITEGNLHILNDPVNGFDHLTQWTIGKYMLANKMNRGGLFRDLTARNWHDFQKLGASPEDAHLAAMAVAKKVTRYHMLDLADALKAEQTFRWGDYFLTKHRLYWTWILRSMLHHPEAAVTVGHIRDLVNKYSIGNINLPIHIPGVQSAGGKTPYTIPIARLFWLDSNATQAGAFSHVWNAIDHGSFEQAMPFFKNSPVEATTMDGGLKMLYMYLGNSTGHHLPGLGQTPTTSDNVLGYLNPTDGYRFKQAWWRIYSSGQLADAWKGQTTHEIDVQVTHKALLHMVVTGLWRSSAFTGGYITDPKLSTGQEAIWVKYNETADPIERTKLRLAHPFINGQLGMYSSSPVQHMLSNQMWDKFINNVYNPYEQAQNRATLQFQHTGDARFLFGPEWNAIGEKFSKGINQLKADAKKAGATDWLGAFNKDQMIGAHQNLAAAIHDLYPSLPAQSIARVPGVSQPKQASWVKVYENALKSDLSPAYIARLPLQDQQAAYVQAAFYKSQLLQFSGPGSTEAGKLRYDYYTKIYGPYKNGLNALYQNASKGLTTASARSYELSRQYMDQHDHPVKLDGYTFPSAQRLGWLLLPKSAQQATLQRNAYKDWSWLSGFQKQLLGVKVSPSVQSGWNEFNDAIYKGTQQYMAAHNGSSPKISPTALIGVVNQVNAAHPGFLADYTRSLTPAYARILDTYTAHPKSGLYGTTPNSKTTWKAFFGEISNTAQGAVGAPLPVGDPARLMVWNRDFRKGVWTQLMQGGNPRVDNGIPLATPPTKQYPHGGYFYRWAMAQTDTTFKSEFQAALTADPGLIEKLFTPGG